MVVGFFDGASQNGGVRCHAGDILKCLFLGVYSIKMNCGSRTNTKGELLALWSILFFAHFKQVSYIQLVGDSKVIVDWFYLINNIHVINLHPWMSRIHELNENFHNLKVQHIYNEYNREVDNLSKHALKFDEGVLYYAKGMGVQVELFERITLMSVLSCACPGCRVNEREQRRVGSSFFKFFVCKTLFTTMRSPI
jgi:ribonuclease HI